METGKGRVQKLLRGHVREHIEELPLWVLSQGATCLIIDLPAYEACRVAGLVQRLRVDPINMVVEVTLTDGTAAMCAVWTIHTPTPQLALVPGRAAILTGVTSIGPEGDVIMSEPDFLVVPLEARAA